MSKFVFRLNAGRLEFVRTPGADAPATHYVAVVYDGTAVRVYVDGKPT